MSAWRAAPVITDGVPLTDEDRIMGAVAAPARSSTKDLAKYIAEFQWSDVPERVQRRVLDITVDGIGAGLFGSMLPWSTKAVDGLSRLSPSGTAAVWGYGRRMSVEHAAMLNSSFIQGFELDDYHEFGPMHVAAAIVPPVLAWAESADELPATEDLLAALAVGMEVGPRLGIAIGAYELLNAGWHCGVIYGSLAAAAACARLARLDAAQTEDALGIAATQASGLMSAQYEGMVKRIQHGFAARAGLVAAALAQAGYTGIKDVLDRPYGGFSSTFAPGRDIDWQAMVDGLGNSWEIERDALKAYSCYGGIHPSLDALKGWMADGTLSVATLDRLDITLPKTLYEHAAWDLRPDAWTVIGAQMNIRYSLAACIVTGDAFVDAYLPERAADPEIWRCMERISIHQDPAWQARTVERRTMRATKVELLTTDGERHETIVEAATGTTANPLSTEQVAAKATRLLGYVSANPDEAKALVEALYRLPEPGALSDVLAALASDRTGSRERYGF